MDPWIGKMADSFVTVQWEISEEKPHESCYYISKSSCCPSTVEGPWGGLDYKLERVASFMIHPCDSVKE